MGFRADLLLAAVIVLIMPVINAALPAKKRWPVVVSLQFIVLAILSLAGMLLINREALLLWLFAIVALSVLIGIQLVMHWVRIGKLQNSR